MLQNNPRAQRQFAALQANADPRARVVPFPLAALRPDAVFAETRADIASRRQPTYQTRRAGGVLPPAGDPGGDRHAYADDRQRHHACPA